MTYIRNEIYFGIASVLGMNSSKYIKLDKGHRPEKVLLRDGIVEPLAYNKLIGSDPGNFID